MGVFTLASSKSSKVSRASSQSIMCPSYQTSSSGSYRKSASRMNGHSYTLVYMDIPTRVRGGTFPRCSEIRALLTRHRISLRGISCSCVQWWLLCWLGFVVSFLAPFIIAACGGVVFIILPQRVSCKFTLSRVFRFIFLLNLCLTRIVSIFSQ